MGLEEALILLYLLVDDAYRIVTFGGRLRQRGPEPKLSEVEVLTLEIFGEQQGRHDDAAIHRYFDGHWRPFFPELGSYQAFPGHSPPWPLSSHRILDFGFPPGEPFLVLAAFPIPACPACRAPRSRPSRARPRGATCQPRR